MPKPSTKQEFQNGVRITYTSKRNNQETKRTVEILTYVPAGTRLGEHINKVRLKEAELADLHKDVGLDGYGPKYLVREDATAKKRARYYYTSAGTINSGTVATK